MELLSGCAIITAHEKAVNRIQILVVGANISCAAPPTAPAISISLEMHRWRQSRPHRSPFGVGNCAEFCMAAGPKFTAKAPEIPGFQALSWYYNQPVVFEYGTCRSSAIATSCTRTLPERFCHRRVGFGIPAAISHPFPICLHSAKASELFCGSRALLFPEGSLHGPHFSNHHLLPDPPVQRHRWLLSIRRPCSPVTPAWFWQG